jgi:hypothetical protein
MDFQLLRDIIAEGNKEAAIAIKDHFHQLQQELWQAHISNESPVDIATIIEQGGSRTVQPIIEAISELSARQDAMSRAVPARERDATVDKLMTALTPILTSLRSEPIDYEFLTNQLTQAVKPHISQLIDLASDKRETASLIVDRILPLLPSTKASPLDIDALTLQLTTEVRRAIAPIDAFEIKEQVADLVVERLDSRLAVRDKTFNVDTLSGKISDGVSRLLDPVQDAIILLNKLITSHDSLSALQKELASGHGHVVGLLSSLSSELSDGLDILKTTQSDVLSKLTCVPEPDENALHLKRAVEGLELGQKSLAAHTDKLHLVHQHILDKLHALPESLLAATNTLQDSHAEFLSSRDGSKREMDELRKLNTDLQVQLTKARGAHGQVRVEKDILSETLSVVEGERDRLRGQLKELQGSSATTATQATTLEARNLELEEALSRALTRLQASDVATQANRERINELEKSSRDLTSEKQALKSKVRSVIALELFS